MTVRKRCKYCYAFFHTDNANSRYCSSECRDDYLLNSNDDNDLSDIPKSLGYVE